MPEVTESSPDRWNPNKVVINCISLQEISKDTKYPICARALANLLIQQYNYYSPGFVITSLTNEDILQLYNLSIKANEEFLQLLTNQIIDFSDSSLIRFSNIASLIAYSEGSTDINSLQVKSNREALSCYLMFQTICNRNNIQTIIYNYSFEDITKPLTYGVAPITLVEFAYQINVKKLSFEDLTAYVLSGTKK